MTKLKRETGIMSILLLLICMVLISSGQKASSATVNYNGGTIPQVLYGSTATGLITINTNTGAGSLVGPFGIQTGVWGLEFDSGNNILYGATNAAANPNNDGQLLTISRTTGTATPVGGLIGYRVEGLAYDSVNNNLYGCTYPANDLVSINTSTGKGTVVGSGIGFQNLEGLAFNPLDGKLYSVDVMSGALIRIEPSTGIGTVVAYIPSSWEQERGLSFDSSGRLYGAYQPFDGSSTHLVIIDISTGQITDIGPTGYTSLEGLAFVAESVRATITGVTFGQINFYLDGVPTLNSDWGDAHVSFNGSAYVEYLNLISNSNWTIQNLPVLSVEGEGVAQTQDFWFPLGVPSGTPVTSITYGIQLTDNTLDTPPTQNAFAAVSGEDYVIYGGEAGGPGASALPPATPVVGGAVKDQAKHENFPNQPCGPGECVPAAVSNSLQFLNNHFKLQLNPAKLTIDKMKDATKWTIEDLAPPGWWNNKDTYMKANNLQITTTVVEPKDIGKILGEIKAGQDVEMGLVLPTTGHRVAVVGFADLGNGRYEVTIKHDKTQGKGPPGAEHDLATETGVWDSNAPTPKWSGALAVYKGIINFVVECPTPLALCDVNRDGIIDMKDIALAARAFGTTGGDPRWNQYADINGDGKIDMKDLGAIAKIFGAKYTRDP
jgi:hypothetical protein